MTSRDLVINDIISVKGKDTNIEMEIVNLSPCSIGYKYSGINNIIWRSKDEFDEMFEIVDRLKQGDGKYKGRTTKSKGNGSSKSNKQK